MRSLANETATLPPAEPGAKVGAFTVFATFVPGDAADSMGHAVAARGDDGRTVVLAFGTRAALALEADALRKASSAALLTPQVITLATDETVGTFLAIDMLPAHAVSLADHAATLDAKGTLSLVERLLAAMEACERAAIGWMPRAEELFVVDDRLSVSRMRGAVRLDDHERLDARMVIESLGPTLVRPGSLLPPSALHVLIPHRERPRDAMRTIADVRRELSEAAQSLSISGDDHPRLATLRDRGLHRERDEDAVAAAGTDSWSVLVVCDGVSASFRADVASELASSTVCKRLSVDPRPIDGIQTMDDAIREAHAAICAEHVRFGGDPLGTTIVAALVHARRAVVGWVGDSRAYFVSDDGEAVMLTRDHSWLNEVMALGSSLEEAMRSPYAHALTRCLGPLEGGDPALHAEPESERFELSGAGYLVLCTDGLWNYFPQPEAIAALVEAAPRGASAAMVARLLITAALSQGGHDNVSAAVLRIE